MLLENATLVGIPCNIDSHSFTEKNPKITKVKKKCHSPNSIQHCQLQLGDNKVLRTRDIFATCTKVFPLQQHI